MPTADLRARLQTMFPKPDAVRPEADFAPGGATYPHGVLYLLDGEVRKWSGACEEVTSPICIETDGKLERRPDAALPLACRCSPSPCGRGVGARDTVARRRASLTRR